MSELYKCEICHKPIKANTFVNLNEERTKRAHVKCFAQDFFKKLVTPLKEPQSNCVDSIKKEKE
jgi:hypothetical protein